jgi:proteic killer suppression protein
MNAQFIFGGAVKSRWGGLSSAKNTLLRSTQQALISRMIKSSRHKGLRKYFESGSLAGIQPAHANRLKMQLAALDTAQTIEDMDIPGFRLHPLKGSEQGRWSVWVNGNWRVTFEFENGNAFILDYEDYH